MLISFHSYKGGTGKTNIIGNFGAYLAQKGKRVCIIDADVNGPGIHSLFNLKFKNSLIEFMKNESDIKDIIYKHKNEWELYLIPCKIWEEDLTSFFKTPSEAKEKLKELIAFLKEECGMEYILFDCGPGINKSSIFIMNITDKAIITTTIDKQDIRGTYIIVKMANKIKARAKLIFNKLPPDSPKEMDIIIKEFSKKLNIELIGIFNFDDILANIWSRKLIMGDRDCKSGYCIQAQDIYDKIIE